MLFIVAMLVQVQVALACLRLTHPLLIMTGPAPATALETLAPHLVLIVAPTPRQFVKRLDGSVTMVNVSCHCLQ